MTRQPDTRQRNTRQRNTRQRNTRQRRALLGVFERCDRPLAPQEARDLAAQEVPRLGIATVYRNIRSLEEEGVLERVELPGAPDRYELAGKGHHHHFHCEGCDRVFDVVGCPETISMLTPDGFRLRTHEVILYGECEDCVGS